MAKKWKLAFLRMTKALFTVSVFLVLTHSVSAQSVELEKDTNYVLIKELDELANFITIDNLRNIYLATLKNTVQKYNSKGELLFTYNNTNYGEPSLIDASNPLRILVYYDEYLTIVVLDRTLSELYIYDLIDYGFNQVNELTSTPDNGLWLYDEWTNQLKRINQQGETIVTSNDLSQVLGFEVEPNQIILQNNNVYLYDSDKGVLVFDLYGQFLTIIDIKKVYKVHIKGNKLSYFKNGRLHFYHLIHKKTYQEKLPYYYDIIQAIKENNSLYLNIAGSVFLYKIF